MKKNKYTCRWRVEFDSLAYDGGGSSSWDQWYRTKLGAYFSMYWNVYVASWGGKAELYDDREVETVGKAIQPLHRISH